LPRSQHSPRTVWCTPSPPIPLPRVCLLLSVCPCNNIRTETGPLEQILRPQVNKRDSSWTRRSCSSLLASAPDLSLITSGCCSLQPLNRAQAAPSGSGLFVKKALCSSALATFPPALRRPAHIVLQAVMLTLIFPSSSNCV